MAYNGRGGSSRHSNFGLRHFHERLHHRLWPHYSLDIQYLYMQMYLITNILEILLILFSVFVYMYSYKTTSIYDPLEMIKQNFVDAQFGIIIINIIVLFCGNLLKHEPEKAIKLYKIVLIISSFCVVGVILSKVNMNLIYTEDKFIEMFQNYRHTVKENASGVLISGTTIRPMENGEIFVQESLQLYKHFSFKVYSLLFVQVITIIFNIILLINSYKAKEALEKVRKHDEALFDEEENVKI